MEVVENGCLEILAFLIYLVHGNEEDLTLYRVISIKINVLDGMKNKIN